MLEQKEALYRNTEKYKQALEEQVDMLKENAGRISKVALVVGGALALSYLVIRALTNSGSKKKKLHLSDYEAKAAYPVYRKPKEESVIVRTIKSYIATFLLAVAQQKLQEVMAHLRDPTNAEATTPEPVREQ